MHRRSMLAASTAFVLSASLARAAAPEKPALQMIKDPNCGCCADHALYLRSHGYSVDIRESSELARLRAALGVPAHLVGCHLIQVEGYVIEGHVPAGAIDKLLAERPAIKGISVPGMPLGSPGMGGAKAGPLNVLTMEDAPQVYFAE